MTTMRKDRELAQSAFNAGVAAADPALALGAALAADPPQMPENGKVLVIAVGKAAGRMAEACLAHLPEEQPREAIVVTNYENAGQIDGAQVYAAAHPVPDEAGLRAGRAVIEVLEQAEAGDLVLALVSGGASALLPAPVDGLTLDDKSAVNEVLLSSGLDIEEMNLVRQNLSQLKGGGMLRLAAPATMRSYVLSDVLGDDLRAIGSGPSIGPLGPPSQARALLQGRGLFEDLPAAARQALSRSDPEESLPEPQAVLIGSNAHSLAAMAKAAKATASAPALEGDVEAAARRIVAEALDAGPGARIAFGGETTVTLRGNGRGGRNQELALRVAVEAAQAGLDGSWCFLSGGTDGRDGPTDAAGGLVDDGSLTRLRAAGVDVAAMLANNDSYAVLDAAGDLLMTGATGTNVADLQLFLRG